ncbi:hypothetical protein Aph02nite_55510 [Actinoplanes philippinensis]|uniref:Uncharacterized protein n=1 Tax=Actinoplanes philippinensis TaxID=35752 RepID=A0A1I2J6Y1_9ACTN|nr:hypothetical protein [Actinoplanes philippinensis]GIE79601.1 hypothetical protein Aph02nite_55510 [Actinoplanes philippinensis]SFF48977.1 hypothetical protein SAMN05421541_111251 [Actinoplanes philippinensis]
MSLGERLQAMRVQVSTPNHEMSAALHGRDGIALSFAPGWYEQCRDTDLERGLRSLAKLLWVARTREYWRILSRHSGRPITAESPAISPRDITYRENRDGLVATASTPDGRIVFSVEGMRSWTVLIRPGTVHTLSEHEFIAAVERTVSELIQDQYRKIAQLKDSIYG